MFHTIVGAIERSQLRWRECQAQLAEVYEAVLANGSVPLVALLEVRDTGKGGQVEWIDQRCEPPLLFSPAGGAG